MVSAKLIQKNSERFGFPALELFFFLQTKFSVSGILSQQEAVSTVAQVLFAAVFSYWYIAIELHDSYCLDILVFQCHYTANCLLTNLFFFSTETVILQTCEVTEVLKELHVLHSFLLHRILKIFYRFCVSHTISVSHFIIKHMDLHISHVSFKERELPSKVLN